MAMVKLNFIGATESLKVWLRFGKLCFNCEKEISFEEMQIDHIKPQSFFIENGLKVNHKAENTCSLCRSCNAQKGKIEAKNFYTALKFEQLHELTQRELDKSFVLEQGNKLAKSKTYGKFAKLWRSGIFYVKQETCDNCGEQGEVTGHKGCPEGN